MNVLMSGQGFDPVIWVNGPWWDEMLPADVRLAGDRVIVQVTDHDTGSSYLYRVTGYEPERGYRLEWPD